MTTLSPPGPTDRVLQVLLDEAVGATRATTGLLLRTHPQGLEVVAASGPIAGTSRVGAVVATAGARGFSLASGQPTALVPSSTDTSNRGAGGAEAIPSSLLVAPAGEAGVLEVADKASGPFSFDDIEIASAFAAVATAALEAAHGTTRATVPPARLGSELVALAGQDPERYSDVARIVEALLATDR